MPVTSLSPFPFRLSPVSDIAPLSYRDSSSFLEQLEQLSEWLEKVLVLETNTTIQELLTEFQTGIENAENTIDAAKDGWATLFAEFMANVVAELEGLNDQAVANLVRNATSLLYDALNDTFVPRANLAVNAKYLAVGDGVADDTVALQAALDDVPVNGELYLPAGDYKITAKLTSATAGIRIYGPGRIVGATAEMTMLEVTGAKTRLQLNLDGAALAAVGLSLLSGGCEVADGSFTNFRSVTGGSMAIKAVTNGGVLVERNLIDLVDAVGDVTSGNSVGAARAVWVTNPVAATAANIVRDNRILNIIGEEGDAIHFQFGDVSPYLNGRGIVEGNRVDRVSRRMVKIQAANVTIRGNEYIHSGPAPSYPAGLIDVIHSSDCVIDGNTLDASQFLAIQAAGNTAVQSSNVQITNNIVKGGTIAAGIYFTNINNGKVSGNTVTDGTVGIWFGACNNADMLNNTFISTAGDGNGARILSTCTKVTASGNRLHGVARVWMIQNDSPGALVTNNENHPSSGTLTNGCIRSTSTATGSIYKGNVNGANGSSVYADDYDNLLMLENSGGAGSGSGRVIWTTQIPSTELATFAHARADVAYNRIPTIGQPVGWICTVAGTPGTWRALSNLA